MTSRTLYRLEDVGKSYESFRLDIARLKIVEGEVLALLGPIGAGKSTLLKLLAGLESPSRGTIHFNESEAVSRQMSLSARRQIGMVHQRSILLRGTVRANIEYGLRLRGMATPSASAEETMGQLGLLKLNSRSARTLSGGQAQLVAIARALVLPTDVLLLDEPTANLDPAHVGVVESAIRHVRAIRTTTIVWATHNLFQARRVADRVAFLWNGELVEVAATDAFFDSPSNSRTADFVNGRMVY